jgi:hypothetical protein
MLGGVVYVLLRPLISGEADVLITALSVIIIRFVILMRGLDKSYVTIRITWRMGRRREALERGR